MVDVPIVDVHGLTVDFAGAAKPLRAVAGVDLTLAQGEVLALLGESGSGKSVTLRALMRLLPEQRSVIGGAIRIDGRDVGMLSRRELSAFRGRTVAMVFQEPGLALDPVYRVGDQIAEAVMRHEGVSRRDGRARALEWFERVRIPSAATRLDNYPHEMSGGMRQRAMIALALACRPKVLLADEPTTALDATVQIQVLLLLRELQRELGLAVIFVTHDIGVATEIADRIAVMYAGRIVESGRCRDVILTPAHPYTRACSRRAPTGRCSRAPASRPLPVLRPISPTCRPAAHSPRAATGRSRYANAACRRPSRSATGIARGACGWSGRQRG
jgi:peptide/nickel transport system ATP-binding protein